MDGKGLDSSTPGPNRRVVDRLIYKLSKFIVSLLCFAKPDMLIADYEWAAPRFYLPGAQQPKLCRVDHMTHRIDDQGFPAD